MLRSARGPEFKALCTAHRAIRLDSSLTNECMSAVEIVVIPTKPVPPDRVSKLGPPRATEVPNHQKQEDLMKSKILRLVMTGCCIGGAATLPSGCVYKPDVHEHEPMTTATMTYSPGYVVHTLPSGYETRVVGGTTYYVSGRTYYRSQAGGYVVVEAP